MHEEVHEEEPGKAQVARSRERSALGVLARLAFPRARREADSRARLPTSYVIDRAFHHFFPRGAHAGFERHCVWVWGALICL